jgi:hypothetical protein
MKAAPKNAHGKDASDEKNLKSTRRRLSVMSDNKLIEGLDAVNLDSSAVSEPDSVSFILSCFFMLFRNNLL